MATKFIESGTAATQDLNFYNVTSGIVGSQSDALSPSGRSLELSTGFGPTTSVAGKSGILADAGRCISFNFRYTSLPAATGTICNLFQSNGTTTVFALSMNTGGTLQISATNAVNGSTILAAGTQYRLSISYVITSVSSYTINVYINGILEATATQSNGGTLANVGTDTQALSINSAWGTTRNGFYNSIYVDDRSSTLDCGSISVAAKRPFSNGTTNGFTTQIGSSGSGYGTGHAPQVNELPASTTNGWSMIGAGSAITEEYNIESISSGATSLAGMAIIDYTGWVYAKSLAGETASMIINGVTSSIALTTTATVFQNIAGSTSYPAGTGSDIGIITTTALTTVSLYECGALIAYMSPTNYITSVGVQQFSITIGSGQTSATATINAVGSLAFIMNGGLAPSATSNSASAQCVLALTNNTTITATRNTATTDTVVVTGSIVDATSNLVKSVQYGTVSIAAGTGGVSGTASISAITNASAAIHLLGITNSSTSFAADSSYAALSLSGTTVTATRAVGLAGSALVVGFVVVEFQGAVLNQNVQQVSAVESGTATSIPVTITSVVPGNAMTFYSGYSISGVNTNQGEGMMAGSLTNATTFTAVVNTGIFVTKTFNVSIVELLPGILNSAVQRGTITLSGTTTGSTTISSVNTSASALSWINNINNLAGTSFAQTTCAASLSTATTATAQKNSGSVVATGRFEVWEFRQYINSNNFLSWFPQYFLPPAAPIRTEISTFSPPNSIPYQTPALGWLPVYPERLRIDLSAQRDFIFSPISPLNLRLFWLPQYLEMLREAPFVKEDSVFSPNWPLHLTLAWLPDYPELAKEAIRVRRDSIFEPPLTGQIIPLKWLPNYPELEREIQHVRGESVFMPPWIITSTGQIIFFLNPDDLFDFIST